MEKRIKRKAVAEINVAQKSVAEGERLRIRLLL